MKVDPTDVRSLDWRRPLRIALVVGTLVTLINQAGPVLGGHATVATWIRVAANYALPFVVSSLSYVSAIRSLSRSRV